MTILTADDALLARLQAIKEPVEIRDGTGRVLGYYTPTPAPKDAELPAKIRGLFDLEAAERTLATQRDQGIPLEEVWRRLKSQMTP